MRFLLITIIAVMFAGTCKAQTVNFKEQGVEFTYDIHSDELRYAIPQNVRVERRYDDKISKIGSFRVEYRYDDLVSKVGNVRIERRYDDKISKIGNIRIERRYDDLVSKIGGMRVERRYDDLVSKFSGYIN